MTGFIKSSVRKLFYRSPLFRNCVGLGSLWIGRTNPIRMNHFLSYREDDAVGPLQRDEAVALFGIVRTLRPRTLVEFGFFHGHSAFNFLQAMPGDSRLFSYDISEDSITRAREEFTFDRRFKFIGKSQLEFEPSDIDNRLIDFVFFDAAHELELNQETFRKILPHLSPEAMLAIHDTGLWHRNHLTQVHREFIDEMPGKWVSEDLYAHQPGERAFIDWVVAGSDEFTAIHFHSSDTLRHGFSLLQRKRPLSA